MGVVSDAFRNFRIPLFFVVAGYLFSSYKYVDNTRRLLFDKIRTLLLPYFSFCLVGALIWYLLKIISNQEIEWLRPLKGMLYGNGNNIIGNYPVWFLTCLFCASIVLGIILKYTKERSLLTKLIIFSILGIIGHGIGMLVWLPFSLDVALVAAFFMFLGNLMKEERILYNHRVIKIAAILSLVLFVAVLFFNIPPDMNKRVYGNLFLFYIGGISGSILVLLLAKYLLTKIKIISLVFSYLGKESIIILGFHVSLGYYFVTFLETIVKIDIGYILTTLIYISFSLLIGLIINRIPFLSFIFKGTKMPSKTQSHSEINVFSKSSHKLS